MFPLSTMSSPFRTTLQEFHAHKNNVDKKNVESVSGGKGAKNVPRM